MATDTECFIWNINPTSGVLKLKEFLPPECPLASNYCWRDKRGHVIKANDLIDCFEGVGTISITSVTNLPTGMAWDATDGITGKLKGGNVGTYNTVINLTDSGGNTLAQPWNGIVIDGKVLGSNSNPSTYWGSDYYVDRMKLAGSSGGQWVLDTGSPVINADGSVQFLSAGDDVRTRYQDNQIGIQSPTEGTQGYTGGKERWALIFNWTGGTAPTLSSSMPGFNIVNSAAIAGGQWQIEFEHDNKNGNFDPNLKMEGLGAGTASKMRLVPMDYAAQYATYPYDDVATFMTMPNFLDKHYVDWIAANGLTIYRNMQAQRINENDSRVFWADRQTLNGTNSFSDRNDPVGTPFEAEIKHCNDTNQDYWLNIPSCVVADPNTFQPGGFVYQLAVLVRTYLAPHLNVRPNISNETWNYSLNRACMNDNGPVPSSANPQTVQNHAYFTYLTHQAFDTVFAQTGEEARVWHEYESRLLGNTWEVNKGMTTPDVPGLPNLGQYIDSVAVNPYIGRKIIPDRIVELNAAIAKYASGDSAGAFADFSALLDNGAGTESMVVQVANLGIYDAYLQSTWPGVCLDAYEGGLNIHPNQYNVGTHGTQAQLDDFIAMYNDWIKNAPGAAQFYTDLLDGWGALATAGAYVHYQDQRSHDENKDGQEYGIVEDYNPAVPEMEFSRGYTDWIANNVENCP